jgi:hypothetical protein
MPGTLPRHAGPLVAALVTATLLASSPLAAQAATYYIQHKFDLRPRGNVVAAQDRLTTYATASPGGVPDGPKSVVTSIPAGGAFHNLLSLSAAPNAVALAHASALVDPIAPGVPVTGAITADGFAAVFDPTKRGSADAFSSSQVDVRGGRQLRDGSITWGPVLSAEVSRGARARGRDPISFEVIDLVTGELFGGTLLSIDAALGAGAFSWDSDAGTFMLDASDFMFAIDMTSPFTSINGTIDFQVSGGIVTSSTLTGAFAGMLPGVGSSGTFAVPFAPIAFDYDLGDFGGHDLDVGLAFGGDGEAVAAVPEPASLVLLATGASVLLVLVRRRRVRSGALAERRGLAAAYRAPMSRDAAR